MSDMWIHRKHGYKKDKEAVSALARLIQKWANYKTEILESNPQIK